jgi:hypothetical protein
MGQPALVLSGFLVGADGLQAIALAGDDAPGMPQGVLVGFDAPALNDNG